ncbi:SMI1/KNR4 family protein [Chitinimonas lacunae]|uniref:SMI1/KNR4 family protein n=1 Tax=Chitinimonas lacunae TaxID=1963018 RepID=A0ABV8MUL0_9NEIS
MNWEDYGIAEDRGVNNTTIKMVEEKLQIKFPPLYLDLVTFCKEPMPEFANFAYDNEETAISEFFEFSPDVRPYTVAWYARPNAIQGLPKNILPIARDAGDYLICFNYNTPNYEICIYDSTERVLKHVADNFDEFVRLWHE